jgi:hypothetical protein
MISITGWLSPTRTIGLTAYLFAFGACAVSWFRGHGAPERRRFAAVLTVLEAALFLDMVFNGRWLLHGLVDRAAIAKGVYGERSGPQIAMLFLLACATATGMGVLLWRFRGRTGASFAACGVFFSLICWCVEVVSLHAVDAMLYQTFHGFMAVCLAWITCALMTGLGILSDTFPVGVGRRLE